MTTVLPTPPVRRGAIDIVRAASLVLVVVAHLTMVVLDRNADGSLRGVNLFQLYPRFEWLTMLSPMPLFFVASGWANVGSTATSRMRRVVVLSALASVVAVAWSCATLVEQVVSGGNGIVSDGSRISTQPLWFLTAWVPFTICARVLNRSARHIVASIAVCLVVLVATDMLRFLADAPRWVGYPGFFAAWAVPWLIGAWWRQRHHANPFDERRTGILVLVASLVVLAALVQFFGYHAALIDAVPGHRSNTTPPTLFTAVASLMQAGAFILAARSLDSIAARRDRAIRALDAAASGLYVWHLSALSLCAAVLAAGAWTPDRLSMAWWFSRPAWFAVVVALTLAFARATRFALTPMHRHLTGQPSDHRLLVAASTVIATVAFGLIGLYGPDTTLMAISVTVLCVVSASGLYLSARSPQGIAN